MEHVMSACPKIKVLIICIKWAWLILLLQKTIATIHKSFPKLRKQPNSSSKQLQKSKNKDQLKVRPLLFLIKIVGLVVYCRRGRRLSYFVVNKMILNHRIWTVIMMTSSLMIIQAAVRSNIYSTLIIL